MVGPAGGGDDQEGPDQSAGKEDEKIKLSVKDLEEGPLTSSVVSVEGSDLHPEIRITEETDPNAQAEQEMMSLNASEISQVETIR